MGAGAVGTPLARASSSASVAPDTSEEGATLRDLSSGKSVATTPTSPAKSSTDAVRKTSAPVTVADVAEEPRPLIGAARPLDKPRPLRPVPVLETTTTRKPPTPTIAPASSIAPASTVPGGRRVKIEPSLGDSLGSESSSAKIRTGQWRLGSMKWSDRKSLSPPSLHSESSLGSSSSTLQSTGKWSSSGKWSSMGGSSGKLTSQKIEPLSALHLAAVGGDLVELERLVKTGSLGGRAKTGRVSRAEPWNNDTPLHLCVWHGHYDAAELLLQRGADVHAKDKNGDTPLHLAA